MSLEVRGKVALVTGRIEALAKLWWTVFWPLVSQGLRGGASTQSAQPLVDEHGDKVVPIAMDLTRVETITAAADQCQDVFLVVNNAGVLKTTSVMSPDVYESLSFEFDTNVLGLVRVAQAFAPILKRNGGGGLVQLNSVVSMKCFADFATYCCASKAAAYSLTQALRSSLADQGTKCSASIQGRLPRTWDTPPALMK